MISFTIITSTPAVLRNQLIARDILKEEIVTALDGTTSTHLVGVREGLEWVQVSNPIVTSLAVGEPGDVGYTPAVMDTRRCYLIKIVRAAKANEIDGLQQEDVDVDGNVTTRSPLLRTKLGQWIMNNSVSTTLTSADGRSWPARRVATNFWITISDDFGIWQ
jgi:hypothetical protein